LFTIRSCGSIAAMDTQSLQQQLATSIEAALRQHQFARPNAPDTSITDAYADAATEAVMRHLQADGWLLTNAPGDWSWRCEMSPDELQEALRSSLRFPLLMAPKPPRRRDDAEMAPISRCGRQRGGAPRGGRRLVAGTRAGEEAAEQAAFHAAALSDCRSGSARRVFYLGTLFRRSQQCLPVMKITGTECPDRDNC
jgi:hypothetical protein